MNTEQKKQAKAADARASNKQGVATLLETEDKNTLLTYYNDMVLVRQFEEKSSEM